MGSERNLIETIRRDKFSIGSLNRNPLASELHRAITTLSLELYQNDMHFVRELIQNAEDNTYDKNVEPSLEFVLTNQDVAEVGASTTLLILNNECGLTSADVHALCSVGNSVKKGKRNDGFIGCKGIGFKSVFMVCETPIMISNGFRICFRAEPSVEAGVGYIVPEWTESPTNEAILRACGYNKLPATVITLPLRHNKVNLVRKQLKQISPEIILFLSKLRGLSVIDKTEDASDSNSSLKITRSQPICLLDRRISSTNKVHSKFFNIILGVEYGRTQVSETYSYFVSHGLFPVTHPIQERREIHHWAISLAFPEGGRPSPGQVGDVFSFLPTELRTGFPFVVNADFILTSSRDTIRFEEWNIGILHQIPSAFDAAFCVMSGQSSKYKYLKNHRDAYKFLPINTVDTAYRYSSAGNGEAGAVPGLGGGSPNSRPQQLNIEPHQAANFHELEKVRTEILDKLRVLPRILLSTLVIGNALADLKTEDFVPAKSCWQIKPSFRSILVNAAKSPAKSNHPVPSKLYFRGSSSNPERGPEAKFALVDEYVQEHYASGLAALRVPEMTIKEYTSFLTYESDWLLRLPDVIYLQVLTFFAFEIKLFDEHLGDEGVDEFRLLKVKQQAGEVCLTSFVDLRGIELLYFTSSSVEDAEWLYKWVEEFSPWHPVKVMPTETSLALLEASNSDELVSWIKKKCGSFSELSVQNYAEQLIHKLSVSPRNNHDGFSILVLQFLFCGVHEKKLSKKHIIQKLRSLRQVSIVDQMNSSGEVRSVILKKRKEGCILLPERVSKWPTVFSFAGDSNFRHLIALSNEYLNPQCSLVEKIVNDSSQSDSILEFVKEAFNAVDLPSIMLGATVTFPFLHPATIEKSVLIFQWLEVFLHKRRTTRQEQENDSLLRSLKALNWVKTLHHGWRSPTCVFVSDFKKYFTVHHLPFLDESSYDLIDFRHPKIHAVLEALNVGTDVGNGCAAMTQYFCGLSAQKLDHESVNRFYNYLHENFSARDNAERVKLWVPPCGESKAAVWRDSSSCIISDQHDIFKNSRDVTVLDRFYDEDLLPFFSEVLKVPQEASVDLYCELWLKWSNGSNVSCEEGDLQENSSLSRVQVEQVLRMIFPNWQNCSKTIWRMFRSGAKVPVEPNPKEDIAETNGTTISFKTPKQVLWADNVALSESLSAVANGKLYFVWLIPGLSAEHLKCLVTFYEEVGVRKLTDFVRYRVRIPPNIWQTQVSPGEGLLCEGLFGVVLAYLCKNGQGLSVTKRQRILSPLISATEFVVSEPFEKVSKLQFDTLTSPASVKEQVFSYYDKEKKKLYCLRRDHVLLKEEFGKRKFTDLFSSTVSKGILFHYPDLVEGLSILLKDHCESVFGEKSVESEVQVQNPGTFSEDEKILMEAMPTKIPMLALTIAGAMECNFSITIMATVSTRTDLSAVSGGARNLHQVPNKRTSLGRVCTLRPAKSARARSPV